jgi:hypothetical protein
MKQSNVIPVEALKFAMPISFEVFGTSWLDWFGLGIAWVQGGPRARLWAPWRWKRFPMHVGVNFYTAGGARIGFESRFEEGFVAFNFDQKEKEYRKWPKRIEAMPIFGMTRDQVRSKWRFCCDLVHKGLPYGKTQFLSYLGSEKMGWRMQPTPGDAVCSEAVARILAHETDIFDFRSEANPNPDSMTPWEVWTNLKAAVQKAGMAGVRPR